MEISLHDIGIPSDLKLIADNLEAQLTSFEKMDLLAIAIRANPPDMACAIMESALHVLSAGAPIPPFVTFADEARDWVSFACLTEKKCYLAAIWQSFGVAEKAAFWQYCQKERAV
mgnify:CR=1 FL=1